MYQKCCSVLRIFNIEVYENQINCYYADSINFINTKNHIIDKSYLITTCKLPYNCIYDC